MNTPKGQEYYEYPELALLQFANKKVNKLEFLLIPWNRFNIFENVTPFQNPIFGYQCSHRSYAISK